MSKPVNSVAFWKDRLNLAKKQGYLHYSVYLANPTLWKLICETHEEIIAKHIGQEDKVLDIACGYGRLAPLFKNYLGIDFSPDFIEEAKRLYPSKDFEVQDATKLPYKDNEFDWGVAVSFKNMMLGNLGEEVWREIEIEIKRVCKKVLLLEYGEFEDYSDTKETVGKYEIL